MGLFASAYVADNFTRRAWWVDAPVIDSLRDAAEASAEALRRWIEAAPPSGGLMGAPGGNASADAPLRSPSLEGWDLSLDRAAHRAAVLRVHDYLRRGDAYQINLTTRLDRPFAGDAGPLFAALCAGNPNPYAAWIGGPEWSILSASPELLMDARADGWIETRPIKGTRRAAFAGADGRAWRDTARDLAASAKDHAEHLMIVDLERNDLGRVCRTGSVHVDPLMSIEPYPGLAHMVSAVRGRLRAGVSAADALAAIFPGGSITGAPKLRAMEIIRELEPEPRGVYTGSLGWIAPDGSARFSVAIRTLERAGGRLSLGLGGGIVIDSDPDREWEEMETKAAAILRALGMG